MNEDKKTGRPSHHNFDWSRLGDIKKSRGELGEDMPVLVYRLMQYTMLDVLSKAHGPEQANEYFRQAGYLAGMEFAQNAMDLTVEFNLWLSDLQKKLRELKMGILRVERFHEESGEIVLTVGEDLDCSGLPVTGEEVCTYDEGFLAGILEAYTGSKYMVKEIDCWASGNRICRFHGVRT